MASFLKQLKLLLWKNGLGVIRQPTWSLALIVWPLVIFIILAITRSQFPPKLKDTCYVAPRNLPSTGFFPFLQTLMCSTDSTCNSKSYLTNGQSKSYLYTSRRHRRDAESHSLPALLHGLPSLAHLQKGGLVHSILKRDTSNPELLELWDRMLNSSLQNIPNVTSVVQTFNNSVLVNQDIFTKGLINFCSSNDTVLEASLLTLNQVLTELLISNPTEVIESIGGSVVVLDSLQQETALTFLQRTFPQANISTAATNPVITKGIGFLNYMSAWKGRDLYLKLSDVLLTWSQTSASADLAFTKDMFTSFLGLVSPSSLDALLKHTRSQRSSDAQPQSLGEQLIFGLSSTAFNFLQGMPGWEYIQTFMMAGHSSMQVARVAMEVQLPFIDVVLRDAKHVQAALLSLMQNDTFAKAWADHAMDSIVQTVAKVLEGHTSCRDLSAPWAWMSTYSSIELQLWSTLVCAGNDTRLEETLLSSLLPVTEKVQQLVGVVNGTVMYNVTPSTVMSEWHSLYTTSLQYVSALQNLQTEVNENYFAAWIPGNISDGLSQILLTRATGTFENIGSQLENSTLWPSMEPYFHMAYWILTYQPNATASPNCTIIPSAFTCQTGFAWETAVPLIQSLISAASSEPDSLLRPLQGTVALLQNSYMALLQQVIANGLPSQLFGSDTSLQNLLLNLITTVDKEIQLLSNIESTQQFDTQLSFTLLNDFMAALGLGQIENFLSGGSQTTSMHPVIMGVLQVLNNGSIQMLNIEEGFAVIQTILSQLGAILPPEQQYQLEAGLNKTHALIRDLEICSALGQDCVADVQNVFENLGAMLASGNNVTGPITPLRGNMTLHVVLDVLALLMPLNMSQPAGASMEIFSKIQYLLEQAYSSPAFNISQGLQASNLTISELEQVNSIIHSNWSASILQTLNMAVQIPQCMNTTQSPQKPPANGQAECVLQLIQTASGLLGIIPVAENAQISLQGWLNIAAVEYQKLSNMSISGSDPHALTEEVLITTLSAIRQNLQGLNIENITDITNELNVLEDLLKNVFREQYPYHTINSTLMVQGQYAQKVYGEITMWYLNKLGNATSGSMFAEILHHLKRLAEMEVALMNAEADMVTLAMNHIQNLTHLRLPLEGEDLVQVANTVMTMLQGELALIKRRLEIQQAFYNSLGSPMNISIPAEIEAQIMTYLSLTTEWITNPQVTMALARIFQWQINSTDITTPGKDLEQLLQAIIPLLRLEDRESLAVVDQFSQALNYALQVASSGGGVQSENFTEAIISAVKVILKSISNETRALSQDVVNNILGAFNGSLQLFLNPNVSYAQASTLTQETIQMVEGAIHTLLPVEAAQVLVPIKNSILSYLNNISQPAGFDNWNELIVNVMGELQNSLPSNNTAQPIISMIIKVTENLLSSKEGNLTKDWIINQQLTTALAGIFQGNVSAVDLAAAGVNLDHLLEAIAPLLSPEDKAFLAIAEQVSETLTYALQVSSSGLQSENFTEAVIGTVRVILESISNETGALPQDVVNNILSAFNGSLQLFLNSNMSYVQTTTFIQETIHTVEGAIHTLLPAEAAEVLAPIKNSILSYLNNISQPAGFDKWNELITNVMRELQNSLPSNNTAQPIISMIIKVTENLLSSTKGNLTTNWIINQQLTTALAGIFQGNVSVVDLAAAGVNLDHLLQAMAPLLSPEDNAFLTIAEQVSQTLNYALQVSSTDGGLQSENFTEAIISTVSMVLESISNETGALPQDVVNNILGAFSSSLQLILNPNMSYAQASNLTQETIQMVEGAIHTLLPAEAAEVLVPIKNSILSYLNNISQPAGFDKWNELIINVMGELQNSLPSNNTAQPIISMIIKVTENLLSSTKGNLTKDWIINQQLTIALARIFQGNASSVDLAAAGDKAFLTIAEQVSQTLTYALQVASTDGGLQNENFTEAIISTVKMFLESVSNETGPLPQDVVNNILGAISSSLQLILNPNMSYAQASNLTLEAIQMVEGAIHTLLPAEAAEVLVPIKNSILSYLNNISQPAGFDKWNELITNVMRELQNSLPSNNTAQPIISMIIKVTENLLSSNEGNLTKDWIINQQLTMALAAILQGNASSVILQGNASSVDLAAAGLNLDHLFQAIAPLLSPEDRAFLAVAEQVSQTLTYALQLASTDGGLQSENFTEAIISTVKMFLESVSNETGALPQDVVNNILGAISGSLQLILNPNMSYAQASNLTQEAIQMVEGAIHTLLPAEAAEVLVPIKNSILSYLNNISQPAGFDKWKELIVNVMGELQNSLPSNSTAQPIISMIIKVTENLLSSNEGNLTKDWIINQQLTMALAAVLQGNASSIILQGNASTVDLTGVNLDHLLQAMAPLLSPEDRAFLAVAEQVSQTLTYALQVASTDGGFQSKNFKEAIITTVSMVLESISNETGALPKDVVNNILDAFSSSLQLFLNPNMSYAQASNLTQETIQMVEGAIHTLLPAEAAEVLVPIKNSILSYLNNISQPAGFDKWNELITNVMRELQNSLPSNNTAQPIISMIIKVTENLLSSNEGNLTKDWMINQQMTMALTAVFQGNFSAGDLASAGVNLDQLLQAMAPLLSPEDRAFLAIAEQVSQRVNYALQVAGNEGDVQSENFTEAVISAVKVVLESMANGTGALPQDVVDHILGAFNGSLQLILNPNMYYMQANHLTQETVQMLGEAIHRLLPAEVAEVLVPMENSILTYLQTISKSAGPEKWNEVIVNVMKELQNSLPSNNTAQPIISVILKVTEYILNSRYTNMWHNLGNFSLGSLNEITEQLTVFLGSMSPFMNESSQTVTESVGVLVQILSGSADQLTFDKLEKMLAALFSTFQGTPMWDSLPSVVSTIQQAVVNSAHTMNAQTELLYVIQQPLSSLLTGIFHVMNTSSFTAQSFVGGLPQALVSTAEAALQAGLEGQSLNCSYIQQIWQDVRAGAGISEDTVAVWCNISLLPVIAAFNKPGPTFNMTGMAMEPQWINTTAEMMAESLETFYGAIMNVTFAGSHLTEVLLHYTSMLSNLSALEITNQSDWNGQLFQMQLYQSLSTVQMALEQIKTEAPWMTPYVSAIGKTIEVILQNPSLLQNSTASPQIIMQALEITLTGMNFTKETINYILSGDIFMNPNGSTVDSLIKEVIQQIIGTGLLGDWPVLYGVMQQVLYLEDTSGTLWKTVEFFNWLFTTEDTGINFVLEILRKIYEIVRDALAKMPQSCLSKTFIDIAGNALYMLKQMKLTSDLFAPVEQYLSPLQMQIAHGQNLQGLVSHTRNTRRVASEVPREPVDDFLDLFDINYQALLKVLSIPPTPTEILETIHVFFANPDLSVILKGYLKDTTGNTSQEETIDTALKVLSYLTLPSNGQQFLEMFMDIISEGWSLQDLDKVEKLAESLGRTIDMAIVLSDQPSLNIAQRIEHMAQQLQASMSNIISQNGNGTNTTIQFLTALNSILNENFEEIKDISPQVTSILQNIIGSFSSPGSQMSVASYLAAVDQTADAFASLLSGEVAVYFNISGQMLQAFALLEAYPGDIEKVMMSTSMISNSLNQVFALSNITTLPNGQSLQEVTDPLMLSSAMATHILFNLSMSNYSLSSNAEKEMLLTQTFNQMFVVLPKETHMYLFAVKSALFTALSRVSSTADIASHFPEISQLVTESLLSSLNITYDPTSTHMTPDGLVYILMTVSNQVSMNLYEGLMLSGSPIQVSQALNSLRDVASSIYSIMPVEGRPYINITLDLMETMSFVLNDTNTFGDVNGAVSQVVSSVNNLLAMMNADSYSSIVGDLEQTLKTILMIFQADQSPLTRVADITQQLLHTIQNLVSLGNSSSVESELTKIVLGASSMNIGHLLGMNDTNWTDKLPVLLTNLANSLPEDLQNSSLIMSVMRSLANESQENLHLLLEVLNTAFEFGSANWANESSGMLLDHLLTKVCALENMTSVQMITQFLPLGPKVLCNTVVPTIQAFHVLSTSLVNQSNSVYDLIFQTFVGDPNKYNTAVDWTSVLSQIVGFNVSTLKTLNFNFTSPAEVKVSELLKNATLFVQDVERYTSFPSHVLQALLDYPIPSSNMQILAWLANLRQCSDPSSLQLDPTGKEIFSAICAMSHEWYTIPVLFIRHVDPKVALFKLFLSSEIQDLVGIMLQMVKFLTDMMHKLVPAINKLQEYLTNIGELNLVANKEFHSLVRGKRSTMSSKATFNTIARAFCKNGILTLFAIAQVPILTETDPSVQADHKREELIKKFKIPHDASPFCMNLYLDMVNTTGGAVAWAFLKPMLLGQILYSPDTPVTREIMRKSNSTLHQFGDLKLYASEWIESSSYVMQSASILTKTLPILQNSLNNPFVQNFIQTQTGIDQNKFIMEQITTLSMLMMNLSSCVNFDRYRGFNSTDELDDQAEKLAQNRELYASIIFKLPEETSNSLPANIDYTIRMNIENVMRTDRTRNPFWVKDAFMSATKTQRYSRGFVYLQESIDRAIIEMQTGKAIDGPAVQMQAFPYPCYYKDDYLNSIAFAFPMALMISWVLFVAHFVKKLVHERELRLHEYMKMMGVNPISHFFAWLIESAVFLLATVIILTIILKAGGILPHSNGFVLFLYLCDYGFSVLAISFLVSSFFDKTNIAGLSGSLIYVICFFPFIVLIHLEDNLSFSMKSALSLFSPTCFSYASQYISRYEKQEEGIQWSNMYISPLAGDTSSFGWLCWLLLIDSVVYFIIGIYIRKVFPGKYGIGVPWYFPVTRSFWKDMFTCCKGSKVGNREEDFSGLPVGVSLYGLTKTYGNRHAVDNLNLSFYEGHVTSLLGHNGAGKTTTMSLLTGLFAPTNGTIEVYGMDMETSIDDVRKEMGVCMQYDVLFDHLTTKEHLLLYAQIKAPHWTKHEVNEQVRRILKETDMYAHRHKRVGTLSGGMKRKLSISIAFIGGSRLVVLDEPTTGVDPCSRRSIWDIVLQHKQERTIILSTHHLDEAEVLSDRIAFLERGGLKCCGSPFYLKDKLAKGYNLTLTKKVQTPDSNEKFSIEELRAFIQSYLPDAQQKEGEVGDLVYSLPPYTPQNAAAYQSLLTGLDQNLDSLQLGCYGISDTTLEEVFLQLTRDDMEPKESETWSVSESVIANDMFASRDSIPDDLNSAYLGEKASLTGTSTVRGVALTVQRVMAMLLKRVHHSRKDWKGLFSQVLLPVLFVIAAMGLGSIKSDLQHFPKIVLSPAMYHVDEQYSFFSNQNSTANSLVDSMMSYPGIDHVCMKDPTDSLSDLRRSVPKLWSPSLLLSSGTLILSLLVSVGLLVFLHLLFHRVCKERPAIGSETWISRSNGSDTFTTCKCSNQVQSCPATSYEPPHIRNPSSQIVYNLTGINIEDYLLATANDFIRNRYGGWDFGKPLPIDLTMDMLDVPVNRTLSKIWYNPEGHHTMPAYLNSLNNFILRSSLPPEKRRQYTISISSHPYPGQVQDEDLMVGGLVSILVALCVLTGYSIMTASFVIYEVQEHHTGSKRLQQISGISEPFYWIINFFYDMRSSSQHSQTGRTSARSHFCWCYLGQHTLESLYHQRFSCHKTDVSLERLRADRFSTFPWMYLLSAVFKDTEMAFIGYVCINLFISNIQNVYNTMSNIFLVFPQFSFGNGLMELARVDMQVQVLSAFGVDAYKNPFSMDVLGWMYISMFLQGFICFTFRLLLNKTFLRKVRRLIFWKKNVVQSYSPNEDEDVVAERLRVDRGEASADILQVNHLSKVYQSLNKRVQAVKRLSVGIPAGECFGLLGVNGAGKTTTFKMLTGDISPTDGSAKIRDIDGRMVDIIDCRREGINIGYCPQVDALDDLLTGEEHLYFYARIRGISKSEIDRVVNYLLKKLELNYHRHNTSESYSCGTRRKLSTALALVGNPQILLLDEPSSGMDPRSKRHLWKIISEQVMGKCAVVLTSHSMEECEALCTRLAIMVKGQFRCLGSLQHIKNRFGKGFTVKMYLAGASYDIDMISNFMQQNFPSTCLKSNKAVLQIKHFSVSQTTLDEVFINFAMGKTDTDEQEVTEGTDIDSLDSFSTLD
ncbi:Glucosylceramide transporter ABCA12 [Labeo rohita]|uniref:Glucosylceramide transporter ABCA12 n=1 Tax=Labeo rohita TaxID=84645 RepID=A0ABQ8MD69_LABRO|nr:Glucosylceramide transporter ABCA12 [Labeo rohita]